MSFDSSYIKTEIYSNGKTLRLLKFLFFIYKCAGIKLTSIYITQRVLATPTLIDTCSMNIIKLNFTWTTHLMFTLECQKKTFAATPHQSYNCKLQTVHVIFLSSRD